MSIQDMQRCYDNQLWLIDRWLQKAVSEKLESMTFPCHNQIRVTMKCITMSCNVSEQYKTNNIMLVLTSSWTFFSISSRAFFVLSSRPTIVMISGRLLTLSGKMIWTSWSVRILLITTPRRPISLVWCRDGTSTSNRKLLSSYHSQTQTACTRICNSMKDSRNNQPLETTNMKQIPAFRLHYKL